MKNVLNHVNYIFFIWTEPIPDYVKETVDTIIKIHENEPFGDVLAFLTGQVMIVTFAWFSMTRDVKFIYIIQDEVISAARILKDYAEENNQSLTRIHNSKPKPELLILPMYGSLPNHEQLKVFQSAGKNCRKVVIATNIAETSITIPGINYGIIHIFFH